MLDGKPQKADREEVEHLLRMAAGALEPFAVLYDEWGLIEGVMPAERNARVRYRAVRHARIVAGMIREALK